MEIKYDKETDSKYIQIRRGKVANTKEHTDWFFLDCDENGEIIGIEILDASKHLVNLVTINNNFLGFFLEKDSSSNHSLWEKIITNRLAHEPSKADIAKVQLVS